MLLQVHLLQDISAIVSQTSDTVIILDNGLVLSFGALCCHAGNDECFQTKDWPGFYDKILSNGKTEGKADFTEFNTNLSIFSI